MTLTLVHRSPSWARRLIPVVALVVVAVLVAGPSAAQEPGPGTPDPAVGDPSAGTTEPADAGETPADQPPAPPPLDPSPHVRVLVAHFAIFDARDRLALEQAGLAEARARAVDAEVSSQQAEQRLAAEQSSLDAARADLQEFSIGLFIHANGGVTSDAELAQFGEFEQRKAKQLTDTVRDHRLAMVDQAKDRITAASLALDQRRQDATRAAQVVADHEQLVTDADRNLTDAEQELRDAQRADVLVPFERDPDDEGELNDEERERKQDARLASDGGPRHQWELTIEGASIFTPDELAAWFSTFQVMPTRASAPSTDLARWFVEEGAAEGLRGDVAFAQAILETGSFTNNDTADHNNFAGIGHCDSCPSGWHFGTPQDGVRAQIQLLKSYVYDKPEYVNDLVDKRLRGPAGCCQTWNELSGVWASAGGYSAHIMTIYEQMLEWLYQLRTGLPPPDRPGPSEGG